MIIVMKLQPRRAIHDVVNSDGGPYASIARSAVAVQNLSDNC